MPHSSPQQELLTDRGSALIAKALEWHAIVQSDAVSREEEAAFQAWLDADAAHRRAFEEARRLWTELGALKQAPIEHIRSSQMPSSDETQSSWLPFRSYTWMLATCSLIAIVVTGLAVLPDYPVSVPEVLTTATGEVRTEVLNDGSEVTLGARSSISVEITDGQRHINLLSGTAYFDVTDDIRTFTVSSGRLRVEVTGTEFTVSRSNRGAQVAVAEGSVDVQVTSRPATVKALSQGQRISLNSGQLGDVREIAPEQVGAWRRNRLVYDEALLGELVADLDRYTDKPIRLLDARLASETITVTFEVAEMDLILSTLAQLYPLEVVETEAGTELRRIQ